MSAPSPSASALSSAPAALAASPGGRRRRLWPRWLGAAALVGLLAAGFWPRALPVETAGVTTGSLRVVIEEEGRTQVRNRHVVSMPAAGWLRRIGLRAGDPVEAGRTVVAELEHAGGDLLDTRGLAQAEARVRAAENALGAARAREEAARGESSFAQAELARERELAERGVIAVRQREAAETRARTAAQEERAARFSAQVAEHELEQARAALVRGGGEGGGGEPLVVRAPVDGAVLRVLEESARVLPAGAPLVELGDLTDLEVRIELLSREGVAVRAGAEVELRRWGGEGVLRARVRRVEPGAFTKVSALGVEEQRVNVLADFIDGPEARGALGDGYRVEAAVVLWEGRGLTLAPAGALFERDGAWRVFVVEGGRARERSVAPGRTDGERTAIDEGLRPGERVIVYPGDRVRDGGRVEAR